LEIKKKRHSLKKGNAVSDIIVIGYGCDP